MTDSPVIQMLKGNEDHTSLFIPKQIRSSRETSLLLPHRIAVCVCVFLRYIVTGFYKTDYNYM